MKHLRTVPPPMPPPAQPRLERLTEVLVIVSATTLETAPIFCWLLLLAAHDTGDPNDAATPFWWMWLLVFCARWIGVLFTSGADNDARRRSQNTLLLTITITILGPLSLFATYEVSPAARAFLASGGDTSGPVALALLVAWLWIRGLLLGRGRLTRERLYRIFVVSLGVTVVALAGAASVQGGARGLTVVYLSLLLALMLFAGPMGLSLAQARDAAHAMRIAHGENRPISAPPLFTRSWLTASLGLSTGLALLALLFSSIFTRDSVRLFAVAAGNIVNGLLNAVEFVLTPLFFLLYQVLNAPIEWLSRLVRGLPPRRPLTVPTPPPSCGPTVAPGNGASTPAKPCVPPAHSPAVTLIPPEWLVALRWGTTILIVVVTLLLLARALKRFTDVRQMSAFSEVRTMLDARAILAAQFRRFFGGRRDEAPRGEPVADELVAGSVRRVYRDTLAAAAVAGRARFVAETPREYERRVTHDDPLHSEDSPPLEVASALDALTHAYESARYGPSASDTSLPASPQVLGDAESVRRWLGEQLVE